MSISCAVLMKNSTYVNHRTNIVQEHDIFSCLKIRQLRNHINVILFKRFSCLLSSAFRSESYWDREYGPSLSLAHF